MKKILIADTDKISVLSTTEIFKDYYPGIKISIVGTSKEILQIAQKQPDYDAFLVDFALPDLNGMHTALKLKKISKNPVFVTGFESKELFVAMTKILPKFEDIYQKFLKKPLQSDIVHAVCDQELKIKNQSRVLQTNMFALIRRNSLQNQEIIPVMIQGCGLNGLKIKKIATNEFCGNVKNNSQIFNQSKVILNCQSLYAIEFSDILDLNHIIKIPKENLFKIFCVEFKGRLTQINEEKNDFWIECEDAILSKKLFESISFQKMHQQIKNQIKLLHM